MQPERHELLDGLIPDVTPLAEDVGRKQPLSAFILMAGGDVFEVRGGRPPAEGATRARANVKAKLELMAYGAFRERAHAIQGLAFTQGESERVYRAMLRTSRNRDAIDEVFAIYSESEFVTGVSAHELRAPGVYGTARPRWREEHLLALFSSCATSTSPSNLSWEATPARTHEREGEGRRAADGAPERCSGRWAGCLSPFGVHACAGRTPIRCVGGGARACHNPGSAPDGRRRRFRWRAPAGGGQRQEGLPLRP